MLKVISIVIVLAFTGIALGKPVSKDDHPFLNIMKQCQNELSIKDNGYQTLSIDSALLCINVKLGIMDAKGNIDEDQLRKTILNMGVTQAKADEYVARCGKRNSEKPEDASRDLFNCLHQDVKDVHPFSLTVSQCAAEIAKADLSNDKNSKISSIRKSGRVMLCLNRKLGIMDSNGKIDSDGLKKLILEMGISESKTNEIVERCSKGTSESPEQAASDLFACLHNM